MGSGRQVSLVLATFDCMRLLVHLFNFVFVRALFLERMSALGIWWDIKYVSESGIVRCS